MKWLLQELLAFLTPYTFKHVQKHFHFVYAFKSTKLVVSSATPVMDGHRSTHKPYYVSKKSFGPWIILLNTCSESMILWGNIMVTIEINTFTVLCLQSSWSEYEISFFLKIFKHIIWFFRCTCYDSSDIIINDLILCLWVHKSWMRWQTG